MFAQAISSTMPDRADQDDERRPAVAHDAVEDRDEVGLESLVGLGMRRRELAEDGGELRAGAPAS